MYLVIFRYKQLKIGAGVCGGVNFEVAIRVINPILTVWEGITGKYKPEDDSISPTAGRADT